MCIFCPGTPSPYSLHGYSVFCIFSEGTNVLNMSTGANKWNYSVSKSVHPNENRAYFPIFRKGHFPQRVVQPVVHGRHLITKLNISLITLLSLFSLPVNIYLSKPVLSLIFALFGK